MFYGMKAGQSQEVPLSYAQANEQLALLKKYDPNAKLVNTGQQGDQGTGMGKLNPDGSMDYSLYTIDYDTSKLPEAAAGTTALGDKLVNFDPTDPTFGNKSQFGGHQWLKDPTKVFNDPNYGWVTPSDNYGSEYTGTKNDLYNDYVGKAIEMTALAVMGGGVASAVGGGVGGTAASGAFKFGAGEAFSGGKSDPLSAILGMFGGGAGSMLSPQLAQLFAMLKGGG